MAALSANTANVQILSESCDHVTVRLFMHQAAAGDLSSNLVINSSTLTCWTQTLTINPGTARFVPGDIIKDSANSNATAGVCYNLDANNIVVTQITGNTGGFSNTDIITGNREGSGPANVTHVVTALRQLNIDSMAWSITGNANTKVGLEFTANSTVYETAYMLSGTGYYGRNALDAPIAPAVSDGTGNMYVSTYGIPAGGGYSITLTLRKVLGFAQIPIY